MTSRRGFLGLFGAAGAALALPKIEAKTIVPPPPRPVHDSLDKHRWTLKSAFNNQARFECACGASSTQSYGKKAAERLGVQPQQPRRRNRRRR